MTRRFAAIGLAVLATGCISLQAEPPPAPEGYPKLGQYEQGKAELVVDGENFVSENGSGATFNPEGGYDDELRGSADFDVVSLRFRGIDVGVYTVEDGDLTARRTTEAADEECGSGRFEIVGRERYDAGVLGEQEFMWGTIQVEFCDGEGGVSSEISGRYTAIIDRT